MAELLSLLGRESISPEPLGDRAERAGVRTEPQHCFRGACGGGPPSGPEAAPGRAAREPLGMKKQGSVTPLRDYAGPSRPWASFLRQQLNCPECMPAAPSSTDRKQITSEPLKYQPDAGLLPPNSVTFPRTMQ